MIFGSGWFASSGMMHFPTNDWVLWIAMRLAKKPWRCQLGHHTLTIFDDRSLRKVGLFGRKIQVGLTNSLLKIAQTRISIMFFCCPNEDYLTPCVIFWANSATDCHRWWETLRVGGLVTGWKVGRFGSEGNWGSIDLESGPPWGGVVFERK